MDEISLRQAWEAAKEELLEMEGRSAELAELMARSQEMWEQIESQIQDQVIFINTLSTALHRYGGVPSEELAWPQETGQSDEPNEHMWLSMQRTDAIVLALKYLGVPVGPKTLAEYLNRRGRHQDDPANVGATLAHLASSGRVESVERGLWIVSGGPKEASNEDYVNALADALAGNDTRARIAGGLNLPPERGASGQ